MDLCNIFYSSISFAVASLAPGQSYCCLNASEVIFEDVGIELFLTKSLQKTTDREPVHISFHLKHAS